MSISEYNYQSALQRPAVIDIGSNSVRLVIYEYATRATSTLYNEKISCKLGRLTKDGFLSETAKKNVSETLSRFSDIITSLNAHIIGVLATAALRDAKDGITFKQTLENQTGLKIQILSGEEEAIMAAKGVIYSLSSAKGVVADLGGGSLELVRLNDQKDMNGLTLPLGVLRLQSDVCEPFDQKRYGGFIDKYIHQIDKNFWQDQEKLYCVGGSWRALASYYIHETGYEPRIIQGLEISSIKLLSFLERFLSRAHKVNTVKLQGISKRRILSLPSAALLLQKILEKGHFHTIIFTTSGIREGALYNALPDEEQQKSPALSFAQMTNNFSSRNNALAVHLFTAMRPLFAEEDPEIIRLLEKFCYMSDIAWRRHPDRRAEYVFHHILYSEIPNLDHKQRLFIAYAAAARYQADFKLNDDIAFFAGFTPKMQYLAKKAGLAARYLYTAAGMSPELLKNITLEKGKTKIQLVSKVPLVTAGHNTNKRHDNLNKHLYGYG